MNYPLFELINNKLKELNLSKKDIVLKMGYKNISKGLRNLEKYINGEKYPDEMKIQLANAINISIDDLNNCINHSKKFNLEKLIEKERKEFQPHILAICEKEISYPLFVAAFCFNSRIIYFDESILQLNIVDMIEQLSLLIKQHYFKYNGTLPSFGKINYYVLNRKYDENDNDILVFKPTGLLWHNRPENLLLFPEMRPRIIKNGRELTNFLK